MACTDAPCPTGPLHSSHLLLLSAPLRLPFWPLCCQRLQSKAFINIFFSLVSSTKFTLSTQKVQQRTDKKVREEHKQTDIERRLDNLEKKQRIQSYTSIKVDGLMY